MKRKIVFVLIQVMMITYFGYTQQSDTHLVIDIETLKKDVIGKQKQLIDVRTVQEYNNGYIDNAINVGIANREQFKKTISKLDKDQPVYLYCYSGIRSKTASRILKTLGFKVVYDYSGGWKEWSKQ